MVINDLEKVKELQKGHGEWTDCMSSVSYLAYYSVTHLLLAVTHLLLAVAHLLLAVTHLLLAVTHLLLTVPSLH